jgi:hypothetical protein
VGDIYYEMEVVMKNMGLKMCSFKKKSHGMVHGQP